MRDTDREPPITPATTTRAWSVANASQYFTTSTDAMCTATHSCVSWHWLASTMMMMAERRNLMLMDNGKDDNDSCI